MTKRMLQRIQRLSRQPANRTKYIVFVLLAVVLALSSLFTPDPWRDILTEFSVTFGAVTVIQVLWELVGGDPSEQQIEDYHSELMKEFTILKSEMDSGFDKVRSQARLVDDVSKYNLGVERMWPSRKIFGEESEMGMAWWKERVCASKDISILSITLWIGFMRDRQFRESLLEAVKRGAKVKIIVYEPGSDIQIMRALAENDQNNEMASEIRRTVKAVMEMRKELPEDIIDNLRIRYTYEAHHMAQIFRCDNEMLVAFYLHGADGRSAPTWYINGKDTHYYQEYSGQFEQLWRHGKEVLEVPSWRPAYGWERASDRADI